MTINKRLKELEKIQLEKPNKVFSMYLNTDPSDPDQQGGEWKIHLKNGLKEIQKYVEKSQNKEEIENYEKVREKVEAFVKGNEQDFQKGIVLFASADDSVWFAERVQMSLDNQFHWEEKPATDQLSELRKSFPRSGIILLQQNEIKVIEAELGSILETKYFELDLNTEDWRQKSAEGKRQQAMGKGGKDPSRDSFDNRVFANQTRWYKSIAPKLDKLAKDNDWERIYLVGDKEEARILKEAMNKEVYKVEEKNLLNHEEHEVLEKVIA